MRWGVKNKVGWGKLKLTPSLSEVSVPTLTAGAEVSGGTGEGSDDAIEADGVGVRDGEGKADLEGLPLGMGELEEPVEED